ncbi:hypothetical protein BJQ94_14130 [Cryobacterium sp. SO2]|uniref:hypothetical protein n=1 Tax=Cryobacterium sp. SO2 TaxID=1897060 RepID=UPI00223D653F|nr:hypothetical protein [Cryobacterium sp. SO2]WEO76496.1 hypothetical protein BJQ94_14130 [Cryobacterium sp. SO2]
MIALPAVILLCAILPFVLSFVADTVLLVLQRGRAALPALIAAVAAAVAVAVTGALLVLLNLAALEADAAAAARLVVIGRGLLLVCVPLAVAATFVRLWVSRLRACAAGRAPQGDAAEFAGTRWGGGDPA